MLFLSIGPDGGSGGKIESLHVMYPLGLLVEAVTRTSPKVVQLNKSMLGCRERSKAST
jgi:hypothetical protein